MNRPTKKGQKFEVDVSFDDPDIYEVKDFFMKTEIDPVDMIPENRIDEPWIVHNTIGGYTLLKYCELINDEH